MSSDKIFGLLADLVLLTHLAIVAFILFGLLLVIYGGCRGWHWVRNPWFRVAHLVAIGVVALESWIGVVCPLTTWEMSLRQRARLATYEGDFVAHWLRSLLYYEAPPWTFVVAYTLFGLAVAASWIKFRPRPFRRDNLVLK